MTLRKRCEDIAAEWADCGDSWRTCTLCLTPELLARPQLTLIDPACGSGEFLRESIRQLSLHNYRGALRIVGFDVSLPAILMARFALAHETRGWEGRVTVEIEQCDALSTDWPEYFDFIHT